MIRPIGALGIPFEGHAQIDGRDYLIAGDGNQTSAVEAWAATPAEMALPPLRCDGSVDLVRLAAIGVACEILGAGAGEKWAIEIGRAARSGKPIRHASSHVGRALLARLVIF